jgi:hypothetical protein
MPPTDLPDADRMLVVLSDIEMGSGGPEDDFPHSDALGELILRYNEPPFDEMAIDLVFNGDTFDLLKTDYNGDYPRHVSEPIAMAKLARITAAHPRFFEALKLFGAHQRAERWIHFITGNHDAELCFPAVQHKIRRACGEDAPLSFAGLSLDVGRVRIEHGSQLDNLFRVDPERPLVTYKDQQVLNISWGSAVLLDTVMPLKALLAFYDRLKPRGYPFVLMPEMRELLMARLWTYWTRDYWKGLFFAGDPTKKLSWTIVKEVVARLATQDVEVAPRPVYQERLRTDDFYLLYVLGHQHDAGWWSFGDRKLLQSGCLRNEYMLSPDGHRMRPIPKSYIEVYLREGLPVVSHLVELEFPEPPPGYIPESIFDVLPRVRELLGSAAERNRRREAQRELEVRGGSGSNHSD